jgi:hypothetical protein
VNLDAELNVAGELELDAPANGEERFELAGLGEQRDVGERLEDLLLAGSGVVTGAVDSAVSTISLPPVPPA